MEKQRIQYLYQGYQNHTLNELELTEFKAVLMDKDLNELLKEVMDDELLEMDKADFVDVTAETSDRIFQSILTHRTSTTAKKRKLWPRIAIAAAMVAAVFSAGIYFINKNDTRNEAILAQNQIKPGHQGATLTLASGKQIRLTQATNGTLAEESGVSISKSADGKLIYAIKNSSTESNKINTLTTQKGETYQVRLPDGTHVTLNAASSLSYPANFANESRRKVTLTGEGYFEVAKDKAHPFIVSTALQEIEVLGTHFNINAYTEESATKTTLVEGSVRVNQDKVLKPGQQSAVNSDKNIHITQVDTEKAIAWKNGKFVFDQEDIEVIMRKLSRWYNVEVIYQGEVKDRNYTASLSRFDHIEKVLNKLSFTNTIHFKIEGRRITVMP